jgi:hypothetical protein
MNRHDEKGEETGTKKQKSAEELGKELLKAVRKGVAGSTAV